MVQTMIDIIQKLRQEGTSILFTTHNRFFIENWSDSVAVIEDGRIIYNGPMKEALRRKEVTDYIGDWNQLREQIVSYRTKLI